MVFSSVLQNDRPKPKKFWEKGELNTPSNYFPVQVALKMVLFFCKKSNKSLIYEIMMDPNKYLELIKYIKNLLKLYLVPKNKLDK